MKKLIKEIENEGYRIIEEHSENNFILYTSTERKIVFINLAQKPDNKVDRHYSMLWALTQIKNKEQSYLLSFMDLILNTQDIDRKVIELIKKDNKIMSSDEYEESMTSILAEVE